MPESKKMDLFERYLTVWVLLCIAIGIGVGAIAGDSVKVINGWDTTIMITKSSHSTI